MGITKTVMLYDTFTVPNPEVVNLIGEPLLQTSPHVSQWIVLAFGCLFLFLMMICTEKMEDLRNGRLWISTLTENGGFKLVNLIWLGILSILSHQLASNSIGYDWPHQGTVIISSITAAWNCYAPSRSRIGWTSEFGYPWYASWQMSYVPMLISGFFAIIQAETDFWGVLISWVFGFFGMSSFYVCYVIFLLFSGNFHC